MGRTVYVEGTESSNPDGSSRRNIIWRFVREDMHVTLRREQHDTHDTNTVAVYISAPRFFGLPGTTQKQIGYLKASASKSIASKMDTRESLTGRIGSYCAPSGKDHPRVILVLEY